MDRREINLEQLLNHRVHGVDGRTVGLLVVIRVVRDGDAWRVLEYHVGAYAFFARLGGWPLGRAVLEAFRLGRKGGGYRVPWDALDIAQPRRLKLRCPVGELPRLER
jgi:hypothetical protein